MRIAFVGKGGSGKTTFSGVFVQYLRQMGSPTVVFDADLNMHMATILGVDQPRESQHLSYPESAKKIKKYLIGNNTLIQDIESFKKTTLPGKGSQFIPLDSFSHFLFEDFSTGDEKVKLMAVGTYQESGIGTSCYHNNLAILENILSHSHDGKATVVCDMVAGVDAFANTLHSQFDVMVLVIEPTSKGVAVLEQYKTLSQSAGIWDRVVVVGNKVIDKVDIEFLRANSGDKLIGWLESSPYLRNVDRSGEAVIYENLEDNNKQVFESIYTILQSCGTDKDRTKRLISLHNAYVSQAYVKNRHGDLTQQIDQEFLLEK